jgi:hypothetical protein
VREIETDYLVVGAGASGMAFADALVTAADVDVVMVDRRHSPGGHWLDDYSFVRLHQPSANYGVNSRVLGQDRIDETGPNAGFYERATAAEICDYFSRVLDEVLVPSGQVRFFGMTDYRGADGDDHHLTSLLTGEETIVRVRRRFVDATYVESSIPSRHTPPFSVDTDVRMIPPNDLVDLDEAASGFTILGAGKTAMDTCNWLLDQGVDPGRIQWFRPRDPWLFDRRAMQPLDLVADYMEMQASWVDAAAEADDGMDFARRLEADGVFLRIDPNVEPTVFRGATISSGEIDSLRRIEQVVPGRRVLRIGTDRIVTDSGDMDAEPGRVYVDCTAQGVRPTVPRPIFEGDRMTLQYVTIGIVPWSAAIVGTVEARQVDDAEKNRLCPTLQFTGNVADMPRLSYSGMEGIMVRTMDPDLNAWNDAARLNPAGAATKHLDDPRVQEAFGVMGAKFDPAMENLAHHVGAAPASVG